MNVGLRLLLLTIGVAVTTLAVQSLVVNLDTAVDGLGGRSSVFFFGFIWGTITNATVNVLLDIGDTK